MGPDRTRANGDGGQVGYLFPSEKNMGEYGGCDRELWDRLAHLIGYGARCVHCIETASILPDDTD